MMKRSTASRHDGLKNLFGDIPEFTYRNKRLADVCMGVVFIPLSAGTTTPIRLPQGESTGSGFNQVRSPA